MKKQVVSLLLAASMLAGLSSTGPIGMAATASGGTSLQSDTTRPMPSPGEDEEVELDGVATYFAQGQAGTDDGKFTGDGRGPVFYIDMEKSWVVNGKPTITFNVLRDSGTTDPFDWNFSGEGFVPMFGSKYTDVSRDKENIMALLISKNDLLLNSYFIDPDSTYYTLGDGATILDMWLSNIEDHFTESNSTRAALKELAGNASIHQLYESLNNKEVASILYTANTAVPMIRAKSFPRNPEAGAEGTPYPLVLLDPAAVAYVEINPELVQTTKLVGLTIKPQDWVFYDSGLSAPDDRIGFLNEITGWYGTPQTYTEERYAPKKMDSWVGLAGATKTSDGVETNNSAALKDIEDYVLIMMAPMEDVRTSLTFSFVTMDAAGNGTGNYEYIPALTAEVSAAKEYTYTQADAGAVDPAITVADSGGTPLDSTYYTLSYENIAAPDSPVDLGATVPKTVGTYRVTAALTAEGTNAGYTFDAGKDSATFSIIPAEPKVTPPQVAEANLSVKVGEHPPETPGESYWATDHKGSAVDAKDESKSVEGTWSFDWNWDGTGFEKEQLPVGLIFTPTDTTNYKTVKSGTVTFQVEDALRAQTLDLTQKAVSITPPGKMISVDAHWKRADESGTMQEKDFSAEGGLTVEIKEDNQGIIDSVGLGAGWDEDAGHYVVEIPVKKTAASGATATISVSMSDGKIYQNIEAQDITVTVGDKAVTRITLKEENGFSYNENTLVRIYDGTAAAPSLDKVFSDAEKKTDVTAAFTAAPNDWVLAYGQKNASGNYDSISNAPSKVGNYAVKLYIKADSTSDLRYTYSADSEWVPYVINAASSATAFNLLVAAPEAGKVPAKPDGISGIPTEATYAATAAKWTVTGGSTEAGDEFDPLTKYTLTVTLTANEGYAFPTSGLSATINTVSATVAGPTEVNGRSTVTITYDFPQTGKRELAVTPDLDANTGLQGVMVDDGNGGTVGQIIGFYAEGQTAANADGSGSLAQYYLDNGYLMEYRPIRVDGKKVTVDEWRQIILPGSAYTGDISAATLQTVGKGYATWPVTTAAKNGNTYQYTLGTKAVPSALTAEQKAAYGSIEAVVGTDGVTRYVVSGFQEGDQVEVRICEGADYKASQPVTVTVGGGSGGGGGVDPSQMASVVFYDWDNTLLGSIVVEKGVDVSAEVLAFQQSLMSGESKDKDNAKSDYFVNDANYPLTYKRGYSFNCWLPNDSELPTHCGVGMDGMNKAVDIAEPSNEQRQNFAALEGNIAVKACYKANDELYYNPSDLAGMQYTMELAYNRFGTTMTYGITVTAKRENIHEGKTVGVPRMVEPQLRSIYKIGSTDLYNLSPIGMGDVEVYDIYPAGAVATVSINLVDFNGAAVKTSAGEKAATIAVNNNGATGFVRLGNVGLINDELAARSTEFLTRAVLSAAGLTYNSNSAKYLQAAWDAKNADGTKTGLTWDEMDYAIKHAGALQGT